MADEVRKAAAQHITLVADILGDGFRNDPCVNWVVPGSSQNKTSVVSWFAGLTRHLYLPHGEVYFTAAKDGAALWLPPGVSTSALPLLRLPCVLWPVFLAAGLGGLRRSFVMSQTMERGHPSGPHFYLHAIGVRQSSQGRGVGSSLLRPVLERCDRERKPAYLESSNERNLPLYERHGFRVVSEVHLPDGGPPLWYMVRQPS